MRVSGRCGYELSSRGRRCLSLGTLGGPLRLLFFPCGLRVRTKLRGKLCETARCQVFGLFVVLERTGLANIAE